MKRECIAFVMTMVFLALFVSPLPADGYPQQTTIQKPPSQTSAPKAAVPQPAPEKAKAETKAEAQPETIYPAPKNIREKSGVYVFLAWLWLTIAILVYVLALKIREADRVFSLHYYQPDHGSERPRISS